MKGPGGTELGMPFHPLYTPWGLSRGGTDQKMAHLDLSLMDKICVINTLVISFMVYKMSILSLMPKDIICPFIKHIRDYIWKGRRDKIAYHVLTARKDLGGLNLANIQKCDQSLKIY